MSGKRIDVVQFLKGRHALVPYIRQDDAGAVAEVCQSFIFDNSAFSAWNSGKPIGDWEPYYRWVESYSKHPGFDWALIPDVIDGNEKQNDDLLDEWPKHLRGVPVWHLHESIARLMRLALKYPTVALGSSGEWRTPGTAEWWKRMTVAMRAICDPQGRPYCRLHGLRMLSTKIFTKLPLASADSTNASVNAGSKGRFGMYVPATTGQCAEVIAERIESCQSAHIWQSPLLA